MALKTEEAKKKIEAQKAKIELKEKLLKQKERKERTQRLIKLGALIQEAQVDNLPTHTLLGALLEINALSSSEVKIKEWNCKEEEFRKQKAESKRTPLIISFSTDPEKKIKDYLKSLEFKWNGFRKEWYGYGDKNELTQALQSEGQKFHIDEVDES